MFAFYAVRGNVDLDKLASFGFWEKQFLHCAREEYYREENEKLKSLFQK